MARGGGAAPPPRWPPARWGHAAWLSGAGEMVLAGGTAASGEPLTDGVWAVGVGCSGDEIRSAERGTLRDLTQSERAVILEMGHNARNPSQRGHWP